MRTAVFLLTEFRVEPLNNHSGSAVGRSINFSLFHIANASSIKQCDDPKSNKATNGRAFLAMAAEVRERRKELGVMEVEFSCMTGAALPFFGQLFKSAMLEKLPLSFPSLTLMVRAFVDLLLWTWSSYVPCNGKATVCWSLGFGDSLWFHPIPVPCIPIPFWLILTHTVVFLLYSYSEFPLT